MTDLQIYLFNNGEYKESYEVFGAHKTERGYAFTVYAPNAKNVSVVGDFNEWNSEMHMMEKIPDSGGVWQLEIENVSNYEKYKYAITTKKNQIIYKADPYARFSELRPGTASVTYPDKKFKWSDKRHITKREKTQPYDKPILIYEMHMGSWKRNEDGSQKNYREIADELSDYLFEMGYTHVELMPIAEHPFDGSWGYQVTGYYSVTSRFGTPDDFKYFVNKMHSKGVSVILDWVPAHFPRDDHGLRLFDGEPLYEYPDPREGEHKEWGTLVFNYSSPQINSFLVSNAFFWFKEFHIDGLRVDAVSSMLYRNYNRCDGEWIANKYGGAENLETVDFIKKLNSAIFEKFPNVLMVAEESTAWPLVTKPTNLGGLGFNFKWNMGWMNDMLSYIKTDPYFRKGIHDKVTFSMMYAFSENYVLPLSHDEVVHGKCSLINKIPGEYEQKFETLKAFYAYMMAHPGKKLLFMGGEFGQFIEWNPEQELDWFLLEYESHKKLQKFVMELNYFYRENKPLWQIEDSWDGFKWINAQDSSRSIFSYIRKGKKAGDEIYVISNFTPVLYKNYEIGVLRNGEYKEVLNTTGKVKKRKMNAKKKEDLDFKYSILMDVPPLSTVYFVKTKKMNGGKNND